MDAKVNDLGADAFAREPGALILFGQVMAMGRRRVNRSRAKADASGIVRRWTTAHGPGAKVLGLV